MKRLNIMIDGNGHRLYSYFFLLILTIFWMTSVNAEVRMGVYYATTIPVKKREKVLGDELTGIGVTVFARSRDFHETLKEEKYQYVLAPSSFEFAYSDYEPIYQLFINGESSFNYKFLSTQKKIDIKSLGSFTLGMVEELDRQDLKKYLNSVVGYETNKIKTVTKLEDLFPLLVFNSVEIIMLSPQSYNDLKAMFTTEIQTVNLKTNPIVLPRIYKRKDSNSLAPMKKLESLSEKTLKSLGFDGIHRIK